MTNIKFNKFQNEFILHTTRKRKTKKETPEFVNTRVRKEIKKMIRINEADNILKKPKYDKIKKYDSKISNHTYNIIKTKAHRYEKEKKMMIQMIHQSLPLCEKINNLVQKEQNQNNYYDFYTNKYHKVTNEGLCPCCNEKPETVEHLFIECENNQVVFLRDQLPGAISSAINKHVEGPKSPCPKFYYYSKNINSEPNDDWDMSLGNFGFIPKQIFKYVESLLDEETMHKAKYIMCDISQEIMKINLEIWKYRCKLLYAPVNSINDPP